MTLRRRGDYKISEPDGQLNNAISEIQLLLCIVVDISNINKLAVQHDDVKILPLESPMQMRNQKSQRLFLDIASQAQQ